MKILAIIPARGGSKAIPKKNISLLKDKPLIAWSIEAAKKSKYINRIIVSTDSQEIKKISLQYKAEAPFLRPAKLATDKIHSIYAIIHTIEWLSKNKNYTPDIVAMLLPTAPLRRVQDIDQAIAQYLKYKQPVVGVCEFSKQLPHLRYIKNDKLIPVNKNKTLNVQRQNLQKLFYVNGAIYVASAKQILKEKSFHTKITRPYIMDEKYSLDINSKNDFKKAKLIINHEKNIC